MMVSEVTWAFEEHIKQSVHARWGNNLSPSKLLALFKENPEELDIQKEVIIRCCKTQRFWRFATKRAAIEALGKWDRITISVHGSVEKVEEFNDNEGKVQFIWTPADFLHDAEDTFIEGRLLTSTEPVAKKHRIEKKHMGTIEWDRFGNVTGSLRHDKGPACAFQGKWKQFERGQHEREGAHFEVTTATDHVLQQHYTIKGRLWKKNDEKCREVVVHGADDGTVNTSCLQFVNGIICTQKNHSRTTKDIKDGFEEEKEMWHYVQGVNQ